MNKEEKTIVIGIAIAVVLLMSAALIADREYRQERETTLAIAAGYSQVVVEGEVLWQKNNR